MYYSIFDIEEEQRGSGAFQEKVGGGANERLSAVIEHLQEQERYIARYLREGTLGTHSPTLKCDDTLDRSDYERICENSKALLSRIRCRHLLSPRDPGK